MKVDASNYPRYGRDSDGACEWNVLLQQKWRLRKGFSSHYGLFSVRYRCIPKFRKYAGYLRESMNCSEIRQNVSVVFVRLVVGVMLAMSLSVAVNKNPSCKFSFCLNYQQDLQDSGRGE